MVLGVLAGFSDRTPYPSGKRSDEKLDSHLYQARNTGEQAKLPESPSSKSSGRHIELPDRRKSGL
jgi:hypothetical protein